MTGSIVAGGAAFVGTDRVGAAEAKTPTVKLEKGAVILFQGDSITDAGRSRPESEKANHPNALGKGYPLYLASGLLGSHPSLDLQIFNRGISGHKVPDLAQRWQADALDFKPAVLSILVGVNDIWHKMNGRYDGTVESYGKGYDELLQKTQAALPGVVLVVCEPFVTRCGAVKESWFPEFDERRAAAQEVAIKNKAIWVPFQAMFDDAIAAGTSPEHWANDGVHPTFAGHSLMAQKWREVVGI